MESMLRILNVILSDFCHLFKHLTKSNFPSTVCRHPHQAYRIFLTQVTEDVTATGLKFHAISSIVTLNLDVSFLRNNKSTVSTVFSLSNRISILLVNEPTIIPVAIKNVICVYYPRFDKGQDNAFKYNYGFLHICLIKKSLPEKCINDILSARHRKLTR